jgi:hypothetical protein
LAIRAGRLGLPMALSMLGGRTRIYVPIIDLYRRDSRTGGEHPATVFQQCPNITAALQSGSPENYKAAPNSFEMIFGRHHCHVGGSCLSGLGTGK